jgi:hypothetical protein
MKRTLTFTLFVAGAALSGACPASADPAASPAPAATSLPQSKLSGSISTDLLIHPVVNNFLSDGGGGPANLTVRSELGLQAGRGAFLLSDDYRLDYGFHSISAGIADLTRSNNYGIDVQGMGFGGQFESSLKRPVAVYASLYYYPSAHGTDVALNSVQDNLAYHVTKGGVGAKVPLKRTQAFFDLGMDGERGLPAVLATRSYTETSPYAGLGWHF